MQVQNAIIPGTGTPSYFGTPITAPGGGSGGASAAGVGGGSGGGGSASGGPNAGGTGSGDTFPGTIGATPANGWGMMVVQVQMVEQTVAEAAVAAVPVVLVLMLVADQVLVVKAV